MDKSQGNLYFKGIEKGIEKIVALIDKALMKRKVLYGD